MHRIDIIREQRFVHTEEQTKQIKIIREHKDNGVYTLITVYKLHNLAQ